MALDEFGNREVLEGGVVGAGEEVQVGEGEAAPRRAQNGEPRDAIHGMEEGAGEGAEVEEFLALEEALDFDGAEGDAMVAEERDDLGEVGAGADENGDTIFLACRLRALDAWEMLLENAEDVAGFLFLGIGDVGRGRSAVGSANEARVDVERFFRRRSGEGGGFGERDGGGSGGNVGGTEGAEHLVDGLGEAGVGAEVDGELHGMAADAAAVGVEGGDAAIADLGEELDVGLAKHIDGLHGVADQEDGAIFAGVGGVGPGGEECGDELVLAARGVLEFVDEEVTDVAGDVDDAFAGSC